jgi:predicted MFS family arabinose efflux permease
VTLRFLDERPADADWLEPHERELLAREIEQEHRHRQGEGQSRVRDALGSGEVWLLGLLYFILLAAGFGLTFFVPDLVQDRTGYGDFTVGLLAAIPFGLATVSMLYVARRADRAGSRRPVVAGLSLVGASGTAITAFADSTLGLTAGISLAAVGILSAIPVFWVLPASLLTGQAAAAGIALVAAVGNLGGFAGPAFTGVMEDTTGGFETPLAALAGLLAVGAALTFLAREPAPAAAVAVATE